MVAAISIAEKLRFWNAKSLVPWDEACSWFHPFCLDRLQTTRGADNEANRSNVLKFSCPLTGGIRKGACGDFQPSITALCQVAVFPTRPAQRVETIKLTWWEILDLNQ